MSDVQAVAATYSLDLVQGERYERGFRYIVDSQPLDLSTYSWASQVRQKEAPDAELVLDLAPFLSLGAGDPTTLELRIPATASIASGRVRDTATWDLYLWPTGTPGDAICLVSGSASLDPSTTDLSALMGVTS